MVNGLRIASSEAVPGRKLGGTGAFGPLLRLDMLVVEFVRVVEECCEPLAKLEVAVRCEEAVDSFELGRRVKVRSIVLGMLVLCVVGMYAPPRIVFGAFPVCLTCLLAGSRACCFVFFVTIGPRGPQAISKFPAVSLLELLLVGSKSKCSIFSAAAPVRVLSLGAGMPGCAVVSPLTACGV